ncbi:MAG: hypothetical protein U0X20_24445 [Caldilineaceae bacterium]
MATSLNDKFQFKNVVKLAVRNAPGGYVEKLQAELEGIEILAGPDAAADAVLLFVNNLAEAQALAPGAVATVAPAKPEGILWIAYPKGGSGIKTDVNRDKLWPVVQESGWRPVRQIALDDVWSAMRFRPGTM